MGLSLTSSNLSVSQGYSCETSVFETFTYPVNLNFEKKFSDKVWNFEKIGGKACEEECLCILIILNPPVQTTVSSLRV